MTPTKIGFMTSLLLHSLLIVAVFAKVEDISKVSKQSNNKITISLENIDNRMENQSINQRKKHEEPKKHHAEKPKKIAKKEMKKPQSAISEEVKPSEITKEAVAREIIEETEPIKAIEEIEEVAQDSTEVDNEMPNDAKDTQDAATSGMTQDIDINSELYAEILRIINKYNQYPRDAYRRGITGSVEIRFVLRKNGEVEDIEVLNKIHKSLSEGAINAINNAYKKFPSINGNLRIKVKLTYNLT